MVKMYVWFVRVRGDEEEMKRGWREKEKRGGGGGLSRKELAD